MQPKVSVIIPVYNVEKYLDQCLNSVAGQTMSPDELEVICVNDGSTDASPAMLARFAAAHGNAQIVTQKNGGLSRARNAALCRARGEYVFMLDSDDFLLSPSCLEELWAVAHRDRLDMLRFCGESVPEAPLRTPAEAAAAERDRMKFRLKGTYPEILDGQSACVRLAQNGDYVVNVYLALYRRAFLEENGLAFTPDILHEDEIFTPRCYAAARRVGCVDLCCYGYLTRPNSIMTSKNRLPSVRSNCLCACMLERMLREHPDWSADFRAVQSEKILYLRRRAALLYLAAERGLRGPFLRSLPPGERAQILLHLRPSVRKERFRKLRMAAKRRAPQPLWALAKRLRGNRAR